MGLQYESVDLEHIITICRERQKALHLVESVALQQFDDEQQKVNALKNKLKEQLAILNLGRTPNEQQRIDDNISHWMLKCAYCRTPDLKTWFMKNEVDLFRHRFNVLTSDERKKFYELNNLKFPPVDIEKVKMIREDLQTAMKGLLTKGHAIENITWFKVPFAQVGNLVRNRS